MGSPRQPFALLLAFLAVVLGLAGGVALHLRAQVLDRQAFADRALDALDREPVRTVVTEEVAAALIARAPVQLLTPRQVERIVGRVVDTPAFRRAFRRSAAQANRVLFDGSADSASLRAAALGDAIAAIDPRLARLLPSDTQLLTLRRSSLGVGTVKLADWAKTTARWAPPLALVALLAALLLAADRRRLVRATGLMAAAAGALLWLVLVLGRGSVRTRVEAGDVVSPAAARDAAGSVWDVYAGDLRTWALVAVGAGLLVAAATLVGGRRGD